MEKTKGIKYTAETLMVYEVDTEKISKECNEAIHKVHPEEEYTFSTSNGFAFTIDPPALFDSECVGGGGEKHELNLYGRTYKNGKMESGECLPRYAQSVTIKELAKEYSLGQISLKDFMKKHGNYRPEHHRIGANIEAWLRFYNKEEER